MKRALLGTALFVLAGAWCTAADTYEIEQTVFLPPRSYVGDRVELRIRLRTIGDASIQTPEKPPQSEWIDIDTVEVIPAGDAYEVRIVFASFHPGTQALPPLQLGDVRLEGIRIHTNSVVTEGQSSFEGPRGQVMLPSTRIMLGIAVAAVIALPLLVFQVGGFFRRRVSGLVQQYRERQPYRKLTRTLKRLRADAEEMNGRQFYIELSDALRIYLAERYNRRYIAATTFEVRRLLFNNLSDDERIERVSALFQQSDRIKFGRENSDAAQRLRDLEETEALVELLERGEVADAHV
jgi:hypothetical protein